MAFGGNESDAGADLSEDAGGHHLSGAAAKVGADMSFAAIVELDTDGHLVAFNSSADRWLGLSVHDLGRRHTDLLPLEGTEQERGVLAAVLAGSRSATVTSRRRNTWGEEVSVEVRLEPLAGGGGVVIARDRSREADLVAALQQSEERSADLQALARTGIWVWDPDLDNVQWSPQMFELTGVEVGEFRGTMEAHLACVPEGDRPGVRRILQEGLLGSDVVRLSHRILRPNGEEVWVEVRARPLRADGGRGLVGIWLDATEAHAAESKLVEANEALQRFAAAAAHDLKSPLGVISSMGNLIQSRYSEGAHETLMMLVGRIVDNAEQAIDMVSSLVESARSGGDFDIIDLNEVCDWVESMLRPRLVEVEADYARDPMPRVLGDGALLRQLMLNLVSNAIKYRRHDRQLVIRVGVESESSRWNITVRDNGRGIDQHDRVKVFDLGTRTDVDAAVEGQGLGLNQAHSIVNRHGGRIRITDGIDGGITVEVALAKLPSDINQAPAGQG